MEKKAVSILFVDDEEYLVDVGKEMLEDFGYRVVAITSPKEALSIFENQPEGFDLVITDYTMPEMTGSQLAARIKEINPDVPIIMCTGIALDRDVEAEVAADEILMKPLDMTGMLTAVKNILGN